MSGRGAINVDKLERELVGALEADRKYSRENDAKFRAVYQRVATYEEFREIVNASHLNPLERNDLTDNTRKQPWNMVAHQGRTTQPHIELAADTAQERHTYPKNGQDFLRIWRQLKQKGAHKQYQYLLDIGGDGLYSLFKVEISMGLLGEMLQVLRDEYSDSDNEDVLYILSQLAKSSRFNLSVTFLSDAENKAAADLFQQISLTKQTLYDIFTLAKLYSAQIQ